MTKKCDRPKRGADTASSRIDPSESGAPRSPRPTTILQPNTMRPDHEAHSSPTAKHLCPNSARGDTHTTTSARSILLGRSNASRSYF